MDRGRRLAREELRQDERRPGTLHMVTSLSRQASRGYAMVPAHHALGGRHRSIPRAHAAWLAVPMERLGTLRPRSGHAHVTLTPRSGPADVWLGATVPRWRPVGTHNGVE